MNTRNIFIFFSFVFFFTAATAMAYKQGNVIKLAAPVDTPMKLLLGYNSNTGQLVEQCVKPINFKTTQGKDPSSQANFRFVHSMQEVLKEENLDVSVKLSIQVPLAGGSAGVDVSQFKSNQSRIENGMLYGVYRDLVKPNFLNPNVDVQFNQLGEDKLTLSRKRGNPNIFRKECGDSVVVGFQKDRYIRVFGTLRSSETQSHSEKKTAIKLTARYLMSSFSAKVKLSESEENKASHLDVSISYETSGNAKVSGATDIDELKGVWNNFSKLPLKDTLTTSYFYIVQYEDLLSKDDFGIGVSRKELRKIEKIANGLYALDYARGEAGRKARSASSDNEKGRYKNSRDRLAKEIKQVRQWLTLNNGCFGEKGDTRVCQNLMKRFSNFDNVDNKHNMASFLKLAARPSSEVCAHYPVTDPAGRTECRPCGVAKQPVFLNGKGGRCEYLAKERKPKNAKRLWIKDLKTVREIQAEAGVKTSVAEYPNYCNKNNKKCGQPMADKVCKKAGYKSSLGYQIWRAGGLGVPSAKVRTIYPNGKKCKPNPNGFDKNMCKTFLYVDCLKK